MTHPHRKRLLSDVLAEEADASFREGLLDQTLQLARRRRQFRKARQGAYALALTASVVFVAFHFLTPKAIPSKPLERPYALVTTRPLGTDEMVSTVPDPSLVLVADSTSIELVTTSSGSRSLHQLGDDELLGLLPSPALLVRRSSQLAELVFTDPKAEHELLRN